MPDGRRSLCNGFAHKLETICDGLSTSSGACLGTFAVVVVEKLAFQKRLCFFETVEAVKAIKVLDRSAHDIDTANNSHDLCSRAFGRCDDDDLAGGHVLI